MNSFRRRDFLQRVGQTTLVASIGSGLALELGIASDLHANERKKAASLWQVPGVG